MRLLIFGATGGTGRELVRQALDQGHAVTAFARDPAVLNAAATSGRSRRRARCRRGSSARSPATTL